MQCIIMYDSLCFLHNLVIFDFHLCVSFYILVILLAAMMIISSIVGTETLCLELTTTNFVFK